MFGGGKNRLLPPIKNPLFNPNGGAEEVRIAAVVRSRSKKQNISFTLVLCLMVYQSSLVYNFAFFSALYYRKIRLKKAKEEDLAKFSVQKIAIPQRTVMA